MKLGIIKGEGVGPEVIASAEACLELLLPPHIDVVYYDGSVNHSEKTYSNMKDFYNYISSDKGVILRSSFEARIVYNLRRDFDLFYKLIEISPLQALSSQSMFNANKLDSTNILFVRDNIHGPYYGSHLETQSSQAIESKYSVKRQHLLRLVTESFKLANSRNKTLHLLLKPTLLGDLGKIWAEIFFDVSSSFPDVNAKILPPDSGAAEILLHPEKFDTVLGQDSEIDIISEQVASVVYGTRGVTPSVNCSAGGFKTYQTIHGTGKGIGGKNLANPIAIMTSTALMLRDSLRAEYESRILMNAINDTLEQGYRTADISNDATQAQNKLNTHDFTLKVVDNINTRLKYADKTHFSTYSR